MTRDYGMTAELVEALVLQGGHPAVLETGDLLASESVKAGQLVAKDADGKYVALVLEAVIADEELVADAGGAAKVFEGFLANKGIIPGSVTMKATVGAGAKDMADDGKGGLAGSGVGIGFIDYASGYYRLIYDAAPDDDTAIDADYTHNVADTAKAHSVAIEEITAGASDEPIAVFAHAELRLEALTWPASITDAQKTRAQEQLAARGVYVI